MFFPSIKKNDQTRSKENHKQTIPSLPFCVCVENAFWVSNIKIAWGEESKGMELCCWLFFFSPPLDHTNAKPPRERELYNISGPMRATKSSLTRAHTEKRCRKIFPSKHRHANQRDSESNKKISINQKLGEFCRMKTRARRVLWKKYYFEN